MKKDKHIVIPVSKISGISKFFSGFCASVFIDGLYTKEQKAKDPTVLRTIKEFGVSALTSAVVFPIMTDAIHTMSDTSIDIKIPPEKKDKPEPTPAETPNISPEPNQEKNDDSELLVIDAIKLRRYMKDAAGALKSLINTHSDPETDPCKIEFDRFGEVKLFPMESIEYTKVRVILNTIINKYKNMTCGVLNRIEDTYRARYAQLNSVVVGMVNDLGSNIVYDIIRGIKLEGTLSVPKLWIDIAATYHAVNQINELLDVLTAVLTYKHIMDGGDITCEFEQLQTEAIEMIKGPSEQK